MVVLKPGAPVVYAKSKYSGRPGPRARDVQPEAKGENYRYEVDKFWIVDSVRPDGRVVVRTRTGKAHVLEADDPRLRAPTWWERLRYHRRFPSA